MNSKYRALFSAFVAFAACIGAEAKVTIYPSPGDLSDIVGLEESSLFDVQVDGQDAFVYRGYKTDFNKYGYAGKGGHYVGFAYDESEATVISVKVASDIEKLEVMPNQKVQQIDDRCFEITLTKQAKFLCKVWVAGEEQWLILSAEPFESETDIPAENDRSVLYLDTGVHQYPRAWDPFENGVKTLYLAPGAVLQATIRSVDRDEISIRGRGILAQAKWKNGKRIDPLKAEWMGDMMGIHLRDSRNITIEGITVFNCPSYQLEFADCENATVSNIKLLGFGDTNNDGIHMYGRNLSVTNSFLAGSDDRICVTGLFDREKFEVTKKAELQPRLEDTHVHNLSIRNNVFWGQKNGGDIMITWNGGKTCQNVVVEDCVSLGVTNKGFLACKHGGSVVARQMVFRNIELYHSRLVSMEVKEASCWGAGGGAVRDLVFENINIHGEPNEVDLKMLGHSESSDIRNIVFRNVTANGTLITSLDDTAIKVNEFTKEIRFE